MVLQPSDTISHYTSLCQGILELFLPFFSFSFFFPLSKLNQVSSLKYLFQGKNSHQKEALTLTNLVDTKRDDSAIEWREIEIIH